MGKMKSEVFNGQSVDFFVDDNSGTFYAMASGERLASADTLVKLRAKVRDKIKREHGAIELAIDIVTVADSDSTRHGHREKRVNVERVTLTGIHGRTGHALVVRANGHKESYHCGGWGQTEIFSRRLNDAEVALLMDLVKARDHADKALDAFMADITVDPDKLVMAAVKDTADA